jgi:hypothetical protein
MASPGKTTTSGRPYSGTTSSADPTLEEGQYPPGDWGNAIFGGTLPTGTGAPGSATSAEALDPTNEKGQTIDGLTGVTHEEITDTGAPGTQGVIDNPGGGTAITYTYPNDGIGPYDQVTRTDDIAGPRESTQANDGGYATGGPQLPGLKGNEPQAGSARYQPGGGHVMRGGRAVRG